MEASCRACARTRATVRGRGAKQHLAARQKHMQPLKYRPSRLGHTCSAMSVMRGSSATRGTKPPPGPPPPPPPAPWPPSACLPYSLSSSCSACMQLGCLGACATQGAVEVGATELAVSRRPGQRLQSTQDGWSAHGHVQHATIVRVFAARQQLLVLGSATGRRNMPTLHTGCRTAGPTSACWSSMAAPWRHSMPSVYTTRSREDREAGAEEVRRRRSGWEPEACVGPRVRRHEMGFAPSVENCKGQPVQELSRCAPIHLFTRVREHSAGCCRRAARPLVARSPVRTSCCCCCCSISRRSSSFSSSAPHSAACRRTAAAASGLRRANVHRHCTTTATTCGDKMRSTGVGAGRRILYADTMKGGGTAATQLA